MNAAVLVGLLIKYRVEVIEVVMDLLRRKLKEQDIKKMVGKDTASIQEAFENEDSNALNDVFNNRKS